MVVLKCFSAFPFYAFAFYIYCYLFFGFLLFLHRFTGHCQNNIWGQIRQKNPLNPVFLFQCVPYLLVHRFFSFWIESVLLLMALINTVWPLADAHFWPFPLPLPKWWSGISITFTFNRKYVLKPCFMSELI